MAYTLENIEEVYKQQPYSMVIPRRLQRMNLQVGECVKIGFFEEGSTTAQRAWVRVELVREGARYIGVLLEKPHGLEGLNEGYRVDFSSENVFEIYVDDDDYRWFDATQYCMVSKMIVDTGAWPKRVMRIPPAQDGYSGWLLLSGDESGAYMKDFDNFPGYPLSDCVARCPALSTILYDGIGADYRWDEENFEYVVNK